MEHNEPLLRVREVSKRFHLFQAVDRVSFDLERGELAAIIGPNGAGKTTLLNVISGELSPSHGAVLVDGQVVSGLEPDKICTRGVGRSFQQPSFFPNLSVLQGVQVPLIRRYGLHRRLYGDAGEAPQREALQTLKSVALAVEGRMTAGLLSYGDQRRLEVAMALATGPKLLLLDEPTAGMSLAERKSLSELIVRLNREQQVTILFIEHDMDVVFSVARKVHVLHQGRLIASGSPRDIRDNREVRRVYLGEDFQ